MDEKEKVVLPEDIVTAIQARLPLVSLVRSRAVCKAWNEAVVSPGLLLKERLGFRAGAQECLLLVLGMYGSGTMFSCVYDHALDRWYELQLPPWLRAHEGPCYPRPSFPQESPGGGVVLLCMYQKNEQIEMITHMGNSVMRSWTRLPPVPGACPYTMPDVLGVLVDTAAQCFKVVVLGSSSVKNLDKPNPIATLVFDSSLGSWSVTSTDLPMPKTEIRYIVQSLSKHGAFVGIVLYCVDGGCNLLAYNLEEARWSWYAVAKPASFNATYINNNRYVINVRERLLCVVVYTSMYLKEENWCLQIWELDFACMTWMVVDTMPAPMFTEFWKYHPSPCFISSRSRRYRLRRVSCKLSAGTRVVAGQDFQVYMMHPSQFKITSLDLGQTPMVWKWLPDCPFKTSLRESVSLEVVDPWLQLGKWEKV